MGCRGFTASPPYSEYVNRKRPNLRLGMDKAHNNTTHNLCNCVDDRFVFPMGLLILCILRGATLAFCQGRLVWYYRWIFWSFYRRNCQVLLDLIVHWAVAIGVLKCAAAVCDYLGLLANGRSLTESLTVLSVGDLCAMSRNFVWTRIDPEVSSKYFLNSTRNEN